MTGEFIVAEIVETHSIEGADFIVSAKLYGETIIIQKEGYPPGTRGLLIDCESQLSKTICYELSLYRDSSLNKDKTHKGYLDANRRVRAIKLKGVRCSGLFLSFDSLEEISGLKNIRSLKNGEQGNNFGGVDIVKKYVPKFNKTDRGTGKMGRSRNLAKELCPAFLEHFSTDHFARHLHEIEVGDTLIVSEKVHGCVSGDTLISTLEHGDLPISKIVNEKLDVRILAHDVEYREDIYVPIDDYYLKKDHGEWYEIELEDGKKIRITGNNPVWMPELKAYRRVDELKIGDVVKTI